MKRNPHAPNSQFVRAILLVKGVHFYGLHSSYSPFLKILLVDPAIVSRAVTVLRSGNVMHTRFNIYEGHLSYILQFLCDFGLYGCGWIKLAEVWQRAPEDTEKTTPRLKVSPYFRESRMPLEVDVASHQILNRHQLAARELHHKLTIPAAPLPSEPLIISVRELWDDERRRRVARGLSPSPELPVDPSESSRGPGGEWVAEAGWWDGVRKRIEEEREEDVSLGTQSQTWERFVMTTFESVQALWEKEYKTWKRRPLEPNEKKDEDIEFGVENEEVNPFERASDGSGSQQSIKPQGQDIDISEIELSSQEINQLVAIEEREWMKLMGESNVMEYGDDGEAGGLFDDYCLLPEDGPSPGNDDNDGNDWSEEDPFINTSRKRMDMSREDGDESRCVFCSGTFLDL